MILVARLFLIVKIDKALLFAPFFNLRLVYLPSDVLHVQTNTSEKPPTLRGYMLEAPTGVCVCVCECE